MVTLHEVITFLVIMQISIRSCRPIMSIDVVEVVIWRESSVSGGSGAVQMFLRWQQRNFFFSSRRRHTRSLCDWSSDVCSSDLNEQIDKQPDGSYLLGGGLAVRDLN